MNRSAGFGLVWLSVLSIVFPGAASPAARGPENRQTLTIDEAKAAFVFNFAKFVEWPADASSRKVLTVGVLGSDGVSDALQQIVRGKTVGARGVDVKRVTLGDNLPELHVLFVGVSEKPRMAEVLKRVDGAPVLTVADIEHFCASGGIMGLALEGSHLRFDVNLESAERARLKVSSRLLTLARTVLPAKAAGTR